MSLSLFGLFAGCAWVPPTVQEPSPHFCDQRGTGLSPRVNKKSLTLESSLDDLHSVVSRYGGGGQVKLIGHSWGAMLVVGYLGKHPDSVSHVVIVEPGILNPASAVAFVLRFKASQ